MSGLGERGKRLARLAGELEPEPERNPYYVGRPSMVAPPGQRSPGWYMDWKGDTLYLGFSAGDAEHALREIAVSA